MHRKAMIVLLLAQQASTFGRVLGSLQALLLYPSPANNLLRTM